MPIDLKPIPAFYCCYLLRSTVRHSSVYVGSTPHPARRLAQHNGRVKGGAVRTSRISLRPWEMACIVNGFPSNIAALQFEWAWQNAHLTRHVPSGERLSFPTTRTKTTRAGKTTRRPGRPRTSLLDKLSNLHVLLRASYFTKWPLQVRFFNEDAYQTWINWCERVDVPIPARIGVLLDPPKHETELEEISSAQKPNKRRKVDLIGKGGVEGVDPTYARLQDVLAKSQFLLDEDDESNCGVCRGRIRVKNDLFVLCPHGNCSSISHVACLARSFLRAEQSNDLLPQFGSCPSCKQNIKWADAVSEATLRSRGAKEVHKLLSQKKRTKMATVAEILDSESEDDDGLEEENLIAADVVDEVSDGEEEDDDDDAVSVVNLDPDTRIAAGAMEPPKRLEIVIEDSDDER